uniref:Uncharacterized protein n=1 Tax=Zea mays TaxID=4577 RepID=C4J1Z4_MAIZE|nr:unknown [Zea mays]
MLSSRPHYSLVPKLTSIIVTQHSCTNIRGMTQKQNLKLYRHYTTPL